MKWFCESVSPDGGHQAFVEANGEVIYAYLLENGQIVGDVWLMNQVLPDEGYDWSDPQRLPFLNLDEFVDEDSNPPMNPQGIYFEWASAPDHSICLRVLFNGLVYALLQPGAKPGWSRLAKKSGPLAKPLAELQ